MNAHATSPQRRLSVLFGTWLVLLALVVAPAGADLRLGRTPAETAEILAALNLAEDAPAEADAAGPPADALDADAAPAADGKRVLIQLGFGAHTSGEPQSAWTPKLCLYYTQPLNGKVRVEVMVASWYTGPRYLGAVETSPAAFADAKWGWRIEVSGIPMKISDEVYFDGDRVTGEMIGWGGNDLILSLYAAAPGLPAAKLGVYYMASMRYYNDIDETVLDYVVPQETIEHTGGVFWDWDQLGERDELLQFSGVGAHRLYANAQFTSRPGWAAWGVPGRVRETDDAYFKAHVRWLVVGPGARDVDRTVLQIKGGTGSDLDRWSAFWVGSALFDNPMVDFRRPNADVRGFLHRHFRAESYASVNVAYRLELAANVRATLNLDYAWFDEMPAQTIGTGGSASALGVGFGVAAGLGHGAVLRFDYGVGVVGPESGDTGIHEFRFSVLKEF